MDPDLNRLRRRRWRDDREDTRRAELRSRLAWSAGGHIALFAFFAFAPSVSRPALPVAVKVDLVASIPSAAASPAPPAAKPAPAPKPAAKPKPKPAPAPPPPQAKPAPKPPPAKKVLPTEAPKAVPNKPKPKPTSTKSTRPRRPAEELNLEDALESLRDELGETEDPSFDEIVAAASKPGPQAAERGGTRVDPELAAWQESVKRHVRRRWITPPEFLNGDLRTDLVVTLTSDGTVLDVKVGRSSGDPFADDNAVRAVRKSSPLPKPPRPGENIFSFVPETRQ